MDDIMRQIEKHREMDQAAQGLLKLVASSTPQSFQAFALIVQLSTCLDTQNGAHSGRLNTEVAPFGCAFADLKEDWALYLHEWTTDTIELDWRNFAHATQWIIERLRKYIAQENDILYPLALQTGRIRLRAAKSD